MKASLCVILFAALAGCATPRLIPPGVSGDASLVTVSNTWSHEEAWPYAVEHCAKYQKLPSMRRWKPFMSLEFDCVAQ